MPDIDRPAQTIEEKFLTHRRAAWGDPEEKRRFPKKEQLKFLWGSLGATKEEAERIQSIPIGPGVPLESAADLADIVRERQDMDFPFTDAEMEVDESLVAVAGLEAVVASDGSTYTEEAPGPAPVHYCLFCERSFGSAAGLKSHENSKAHLARVREAEGTPAPAPADATRVDGNAPITSGTESASMEVDPELLEE
jgi:hypothetical protein